MGKYGVNPFREEDDPVMYWHYEGLSPSQIAAKLGRMRGDVRKHVVSHWSWDKRQRRLAR